MSCREARSKSGNTVQRPAYSVLDNYMLRLTSNYKMADWEAALKEFMDGLQ